MPMAELSPAPPVAAPARPSIAGLVAGADRLLGRLSPSLVSLMLRFALAVPFFKSGLTKWDAPFVLSGGALFLFQDEFRLHLFGAEIPFPAPEVTAFLSGAAEIVLPILLVLGLATRFAALGLLIMTAIIQLTIPDGWANFHLPWAALAAAILVIGPGRIALDAVISRLFGTHASR